MSAQANPQTSDQEQVDIPPTALVACPLAAFNLRPVVRCADCTHFAGLVDRLPDGGHPFKVRYVVQCAARPVHREIKELAA
ncbi:hypothetical protein P3G55_23190 [Leptospira sp. 96542]|nr:hypothetical protein [Leptospira sp. 96542]